jgi:hypothetical protein
MKFLVQLGVFASGERQHCMRNTPPPHHKLYTHQASPALQNHLRLFRAEQQCCERLHVKVVGLGLIKFLVQLGVFASGERRGTVPVTAVDVFVVLGLGMMKFLMQRGFFFLLRCHLHQAMDMTADGLALHALLKSTAVDVCMSGCPQWCSWASLRQVTDDEADALFVAIIL